MWSFFSDLIKNPDATKTVVVMDADEAGSARRHHLRPRRVMAVWGGTLLGAGLIFAALVAFTPLRTLIPGYSPESMRQKARQNARRVQALQDSISTQRRYVQRIRQLITGDIDSLPSVPSPQVQDGGSSVSPSESASRNGVPDTVGFGQNDQLIARARGEEEGATSPPLSALNFSVPVEPPVSEGFPTRGFNAKTSHFGIDIAVSEGSYVRAIGAGYVVLADWTRNGGNTVVVQHANGYLSVYKHNKRLLKHLGDRVRAQEPLAVSGNTGEITTGPHLHFELWHDGLAQDPQLHVAGW